MAEQSAKFVEGSTMRHILVMSGTSTVGIMAIFIVDLLDMLFISMLGQAELAAAVGFAGTLTFFATSVSIGTSIAMGALMSKAIGAKDISYAREIGSSVLVISFLISAIVTAVMCAYIPNFSPRLAQKAKHMSAQKPICGSYCRARHSLRLGWRVVLAFELRVMPSVLCGNVSWWHC
ncbi:multidrug and toxin extrusion (MATE) family efflux pump YdhE/NorM homolog [Vibrio maritimus]|uniref:Multidrug and toxin extrusion (MATE) family efflux pump YdhE/NorM homolog n=1 Tax=Vibrio maritimus TaxID=990268 RepID=A0A090S507_9VIBR|nr:multidrug and toxin extrusion (MATE) family efflux pump YdhE/NorM homolog [Vibrio maritimus]